MKTTCPNQLGLEGWQEMVLQRQAALAAHTKSWWDGSRVPAPTNKILSFSRLFPSLISPIWDTPGTAGS